MDGPDEVPDQAGSEASSPYIDPRTGFLRNEVAATTAEELADVWADRLPGRLAAFAESSMPCTGDRAHLQAIHRLLFEDMFDWAGQFRTTDIDKQGTDFVPAAEVEAEIGKLFADLAAEDLLQGLPRELFVARLADYYARLNHIHPFREGNGRTQRLFWWHVALHAGWAVDVVRMSKQANDEASRAASQDGDLEPLIALLAEATSSAPSIEQAKADLVTSVRRGQRWRRFRRWLRVHANPDRLPQPGPTDEGRRI